MIIFPPTTTTAITFHTHTHTHTQQGSDLVDANHGLSLVGSAIYTGGNEPLAKPQRTSAYFLETLFSSGLFPLDTRFFSLLLSKKWGSPTNSNGGDGHGRSRLVSYF